MSTHFRFQNPPDIKVLGNYDDNLPLAAVWISWADFIQSVQPLGLTPANASVQETLNAMLQLPQILEVRLRYDVPGHFLDELGPWRDCAHNKKGENSQQIIITLTRGTKASISAYAPKNSCLGAQLAERIRVHARNLPETATACRAVLRDAAARLVMLETRVECLKVLQGLAQQGSKLSRQEQPLFEQSTDRLQEDFDKWHNPTYERRVQMATLPQLGGLIQTAAEKKHDEKVALVFVLTCLGAMLVAGIFQIAHR